MRTVIEAFPADTAETCPPDTVATLRSLELQNTVGSVAFEGLTVAIKEALSPSVSSKEYLFIDTPVTFVASTVTVQGELVTPSVEAVIVAVPSFRADN